MTRASFMYETSVPLLSSKDSSATQVRAKESTDIMIIPAGKGIDFTATEVKNPITSSNNILESSVQAHSTTKDCILTPLYSVFLMFWHYLRPLNFSNAIVYTLRTIINSVQFSVAATYSTYFFCQLSLLHFG